MFKTSLTSGCFWCFISFTNRTFCFTRRKFQTSERYLDPAKYLNIGFFYFFAKSEVLWNWNHSQLPYFFQELQGHSIGCIFCLTFVALLLCLFNVLFTPGKWNSFVQTYWPKWQWNDTLFICTRVNTHFLTTSDILLSFLFHLFVSFCFKFRLDWS